MDKKPYILNNEPKKLTLVSFFVDLIYAIAGAAAIVFSIAYSL